MQADLIILITLATSPFWIMAIVIFIPTKNKRSSSDDTSNDTNRSD